MFLLIIHRTGLPPVVEDVCEETGNLHKEWVQNFITENENENENERKKKCSFKDILYRALVLNSTAEIQEAENGVGLPKQIGSKTECALLQMCMNLQQDMKLQEMRKNPSNKLVHLFPFSSAKKRMSILVQNPNQKFADPENVSCMQDIFDDDNINNNTTTTIDNNNNGYVMYIYIWIYVCVYGYVYVYYMCIYIYKQNQTFILITPI